MIISSLADYYQQLLHNPKSGVVEPGWSKVRIKYMLELAPDGQLLAVVPCGDGKHGVEAIVPEQVTRSSGVKPNFLCDNASYLLGLYEKEDGDEKEREKKRKRAIQCFEASKEIHCSLLSDVNNEIAKAIILFFGKWEPENQEKKDIPGFLEKDLLSGGWISFWLRENGKTADAVSDDEIKRAWICSREGEEDNTSCMISLVTGNNETIARIHPYIKGIKNAQSAGASLVSFNKSAFESYGHTNEKGRNAPIDVSSTQAYVTALNYLLASSNHHGFIADSTVVFWSKKNSSDSANCDVFALAMGFAQTSKELLPEAADENLKAAVKNLSWGKMIDVQGVSLGDEFFLLGLAPNNARVSVRFFLHDTFGALMQHIEEHYKLVDICHSASDKRILTPYWLLESIEKSKSSNSKNDKSVSTPLSAPLLRSILQGTPYPESLFQNVLLRIRAKQEVKREYAAIIKAYLIRNTQRNETEVTVGLNEENTSMSYLLGRAFYVFEWIQEMANGDTNIASRYLGSAAATPAVTFPILLKLSTAHLSKIGRKNKGTRIYLEQRLGGILSSVGNEFPKHLSLPEQGEFYLGYYQQKQARYQKKDSEDPEN